MKRMCRVIGVKPEIVSEYKRIHAAVWPEILKAIAGSNVKNYSIFLREPENLLISYWEYHGTDFASDMAAMAADPKTQEWWKLCSPMQRPLEARQPDEWWAMMETVFHHD